MTGKSARGFTLLEVLVAVLVLGVAMAAILSAIARYSSRIGGLRERTLAMMVAHNRVAELQLASRLTQQPVPVGESSDEADMGGLRWPFRTVVTPSEAAQQFPTLRRVEVSVFMPDSPTDGDGADRVIRLETFVDLP